MKRKSEICEGVELAVLSDDDADANRFVFVGAA